jgi:hypothetical protein
MRTGQCHHSERGPDELLPLRSVDSSSLSSFVKWTKRSSMQIVFKKNTRSLSPHVHTTDDNEAGRPAGRPEQDQRQLSCVLHGVETEMHS